MLALRSEESSFSILTYKKKKNQNYDREYKKKLFIFVLIVKTNLILSFRCFPICNNSSPRNRHKLQRFHNKMYFMDFHNLGVC